MEWAPEAEEPSEAALAVEGLLSAWKQEQRGQTLCVPLAGAVQKVQPWGQGTKPSVSPLHCVALARAIEAPDPHSVSGTALVGSRAL